MDDLVAIARIVRPRGIRGELVAEILTDFPERFDGLKESTAVLPNGGIRELKIENAWFQNERIVLKFEGVDSIESADPLRGADICIPEAEAADLDEGEFFDWQLEGCSAITVEGDTLGTVRELMRTGGPEILVIDGKEKEYLVPFTESICTVVDVENKKIVIDPPEGLLEF
ncbi:MAG: ribosome maturation factor RimM [Pyrinomonadaceae bacterium]